VISAPKNAKPFSELVKVADELTGSLGGLGALGSSGSSGGSGSGSAASSQANIEKYATCIEQAKGDSAKAQKCAALLGS